MQRPSLLPSGPALRDLVVRSICSSDLRREWLWLRRHPRYITKVPEIIFQQIYDCITTKLFAFFTILETSVPNPLHKILAKHSLRTATLVTTNFDRLLEAAGAPHVHHLHGDLADPEVMVTRITQVGRGLTREMEQQFSAAARGRTVCVIGYSGNDHDIATACQRSRAKKVMWLARNVKDVAWQNMGRFVPPGAPLVAASGDVNELGRLLGAPPASGRAGGSVDQRRRRLARAAADQLTHAERFACLAEICFAIEEYAEAAALAQRGLRTTRSLDLSALLRSVAANSLKVNGRFDEAAAILHPITRLPRTRVAPYEYAAAQNALGTVWMEREKYNAAKALRAFRSALSALEHVVVDDDVSRERTALLRGRLHNNIGLALDFSARSREAVEHFKLSLDEKLTTGDLMGQSQALINLGLAYYAMRDFARAQRTLRKAATIYEQYGFVFQKAYALRRRGTIAGDQGRRGQARNLLREALAIYDTIPTAIFGRHLTRELIEKYEG